MDSQKQIVDDSENKTAVGNDFVEGLDADLSEASFVIGLGKAGDRGEYHTLNDPSAPYQRDNLVERQDVLQIQCRSREVVHGILSLDDSGDKYATLLVYDVYMDSAKRSRRIISAAIEFQFSTSVADGSNPLVHKIVPLGRMSVSPSARDEATTVGGEVNLTAPVFANVGAAAKWEKTMSRTTVDEARVTGYIWSDDYGRPVTARWSLTENPSTKSGVPSFLRCAILLSRADDKPFQCKVTIKVESDWKSKIERLFGRTPPDEPVLFDPTMEPTNRLRPTGYDVDNLGHVDLGSEFVDIRFNTPFTPGQGLLD